VDGSFGLTAGGGSSVSLGDVGRQAQLQGLNVTGSSSGVPIAGLSSLGLRGLASALSGNQFTPQAATGSTAAALAGSGAGTGTGNGAGTGTGNGGGAGSSTAAQATSSDHSTTAGGSDIAGAPTQPSGQVVVPGAMVALPPRPAMPDTGTPGIDTPFPSLGDAARWLEN
jgi:hypothetical protein